MYGQKSLNLDFDKTKKLKNNVSRLALLPMIFKEYASGWIHPLKVHWKLYIYMTLAFMVSAPSIDCASSSIISCEEVVARKITGNSVWHVELDSYRIKNGMLGPHMKHTLNGSIENCSDVHSFALSRSWLKFSGTTQSSILRKPLVGIWG